MDEKITLEKDELKELLELTEKANNAPVIIVAPGTKDLSTQAWNRVRENWDMLGEKYDFAPSDVKGINTTTGEVKV